MIAIKELNKLFGELKKKPVAQIELGDSLITIQFHQIEGTFSLHSSVYRGENYIPGGVRKCLTLKPPFHQMIRTYFTVREENFEIYLHFVGSLESICGDNFRFILDEFSTLAHEWRRYLDDHDKKDHLPVRVK